MTELQRSEYRMRERIITVYLHVRKSMELDDELFSDSWPSEMYNVLEDFLKSSKVAQDQETWQKVAHNLGRVCAYLRGRTFGVDWIDIMEELENIVDLHATSAVESLP